MKEKKKNQDSAAATEFLPFPLEKWRTEARGKKRIERERERETEIKEKKRVYIPTAALLAPAGRSDNGVIDVSRPAEGGA